jgi:hypothetical protein
VSDGVLKPPSNVTDEASSIGGANTTATPVTADGGAASATSTIGSI